MSSNNASPRWLEEEATDALMEPEEGLEGGGDEEELPAGGRVTRSSTKADSGRKRQTWKLAGHFSPQQTEEDDTQGERKRRITKPFFAILSTIIVLLSLVSVAYNLYLIIQKDGTTTSILPRIYRGFAIVLAFAAILTEASVKWWKKLCPVLSYLFVRGFFYCLIAILSLEDFNARDDNVVGFVFLGFGLFYVALALMCVQRHVEIM
ncbi:hypothetical protein VYU27_000688 [Nannochloropsis oceanica]